VADDIRELLDRHGDAAVSLDTELRRLHKQGRTSDALIAIARALDEAAQGRN
jgi:hypothetical protein